MVNTLKKFKVFFEESKIELKKVNWPSRQDTIRYTIFVVILSIALALFLGLWDAIFLKAIERIIA